MRIGLTVNPVMRRTNAIFARVAIVFVCVTMLMPLYQAIAAEPTPLSIAWVSTDKQDFDPSKGEKITFRFRVSQPSNISIHLQGPGGERVTVISNMAVKAGDQNLEWDGKDKDKKSVAPDAYAYVISAASQITNERVTYDLSDKSGGEAVYAEEAALNSKGTITFALSQPSRVRMFISGSEDSWPVVTLLDWVPRPAGKNTEQWDGWDAEHIVNARGMGLTFAPIIYAYSLPQNTVIVKGVPSASKISKATAALKTSDIPTRKSDSQTLHLHANHPRERCFNPKITAHFMGESGKAGKQPVAIAKPTSLTFDIAPDQGANHVKPIPRQSVFVFVDGKLVERLLVGYAPYQWIVDPAKLTPGEHVITGVFTWREDHFGIVHRKVRIESPKAQGKELKAASQKI